MDGTSPGQGDSRLFLGEEKDAAAFCDFLTELRKQFAVAKVFLYGHSQGGFFVAYYAGEFPDTVKMAEEIITSQAAEIEQMQEMLAG